MPGYPTPPSPWFEYFARVQPRHTDYAGIAWHGSCLEWMEAARIEVFRSVGLEYSDLVDMGCNLPVVDLSLRYRQPIQMGKEVVVKSRIRAIEKIKLCWDQDVYCGNNSKPSLLGKVTLVPLHSKSGRVLRTPPQEFKNAIEQIFDGKKV
ncbi:thioesterase family protein [Acaryochloris sp. IP29b_bin.137]|uniref:acyl-CoA thioesterase n=1 Tax=Acaryochloris sp. IP29b_bin.137 TaxID=2969217 RepID=UPI002619743D|nr:thioesterase family protein [Acaryochloris sp. IP29b_bin.137]